jgi:hypothetical protein
MEVKDIFALYTLSKHGTIVEMAFTNSDSISNSDIVGRTGQVPPLHGGTMA